MANDVTRREFLQRGALVGTGIALGGSTLITIGGRRTYAGAAPARNLRTLTVGMGASPPALDPLTVDTPATASFWYALWDPGINITFNNNGRVQIGPGLIESWRVLDDKLTWEFRLREGLKFDNDEDWDAEAFAFSLDWPMKERSAIGMLKFRLQPVFDRVQVVNKYTVQLKTKTPYVLTPNAFIEIGFVPPRYYQRVGPQGFGQAPVGMGAFRFVEWTRGQQVVLERNPRYWRGPAQFDRLVFRSFPEDSTRVAALEAGEIDIAFNVPPDAAARLRSRGTSIKWSPIGQGMNLPMKLTIPSPFTDIRVRQAMNFALNKQLMIDTIMGGFGRMLRGQLAGPSAIGYNPNLTPYPYDLDRAKRLLDQASISGAQIEFDGSQGRYLKHKEAEEFVVGEYKKVGLDLRLQILDFASHIDKVYSPRSAPLSYSGFNWFPIMDSLQTLGFWHTNFSRKLYSDGRFDGMLDAARGEFDLSKRVELMRQAHAYLREQTVTVWLFEAPDVFGVGKKVASFTPTPDNRIHFDTVQVV